MCKKVIAMVMVVAMFAGIMVMPVSAAKYSAINYRDYVTGETVDNGRVYLFHQMGNYMGDVKVTPCLHAMTSGSMIAETTNWGGLGFYAEWDKEYTLYATMFRKGNYLLDLSDIESGSLMTWEFDFTVYGGPYGTPKMYFLWNFYNENGAKVGNYRYDFGRDYADSGTYGEHSFTLEKPDGAVYMDFYVYLTDFSYAGELYGSGTYYLEVENWGYTVTVPEYKWEKEQEKNEALDSGDENIGEILDVIPDESEGFANALKDFTSAMSYEGTEAVLPIPALVLPEIKGLIPETVLLESQDFDLGSYIQMMPEWLLLLVQSLLTIALIVYCFKELYDTIAYVMTLRKGA